MTAQRQLINFEEVHPGTGTAWVDMDDDAAVRLLVDALLFGLAGASHDNVEHTTSALVRLSRRMVEQTATSTILATISLADDATLRTELAHFRIPYQKDRDAAWLGRIERRIDDPFTALCLNAVLGSTFLDRYWKAAHLVADAERSGEESPGTMVDLLLEGKDPSVAEAAAITAAALEYQLHANGRLGRAADRFFADTLSVCQRLIGGAFLLALAEGLQARLDTEVPAELTSGTDALMEELDNDDRPWPELAALLGDLADGRSRSGLLIPTAVLDAEDPQVALAAMSEETSALIDDLAGALAGQVEASLLLARHLRPAGTGPRTLEDIRRNLARSEADPVAEALTRLEGPDFVADHMEAIRERAAALVDAGETAPPDLVALLDLVTGTRDLDLTAVFSSANPGQAALATVAYAGELSISEPPEDPEDEPARDQPTPGPGPTPSTGSVLDMLGTFSRPPTGTLHSWRPFDPPALPDQDENPSHEGAPDRWLGSTLPGLSRPPRPGAHDEPAAATPPVPVAGPEAGASDAASSSSSDAAPDPDAHAAPQQADTAEPVPSRQIEPGVDELDEPADGPDTPRKSSAGAAPGPLAPGSVERSAFVQALRSHRYGAAFHIASAAGAPDAELWHFTALADAVAAGTGPIAGAIGPVVEALTDGTDLALGDRERGLAEVAYLAGARAALVAPHTPTTAVFEAAARSLPELNDFTEAVIQTSRQGVALIDHVLSQAADLADAERQVGEAADAARRWRADTYARKIKYHRATEVLRVLVAENGQIGELCVEAARQYPSDKDKRDAAEDVLLKVNRLRDDRVSSDAFDAAHAKAFEIHSGARERLRSYWNEGLDLAAAWANSVIDLDAARGAGNDDGWQAGFLHRLREAHTASEALLDELVAGLEADESDKTRASGAVGRKLLESIRALLRGERPAQTLDLPDAVMNLDTLSVAGFRLAPDWKVVRTGDLTSQTGLSELANALEMTPQQSLRAAFDRRILAEDHVGTRLCLEALARLGDHDLDGLANRDAIGAAAARAAVTDIWKDTEDRLAADARLGYLDEATRRAWTADLYAADPTHRNDLDACRDAIESIQQRSSLNRDARTAESHQEIAAAAEADPAVAAGLARILARVEAGDLATAWEYVSLAREGTAIPEAPQPPIDIHEFFPERDGEIATAVNLRQRSIATTAADGGVCGPLDFAKLTAPDRTAARDGLAAWREMSVLDRPGARFDEWADHLPAVLTALGATVERFERSPLTPEKEYDRVWVDLIGLATTGDPIVPAFAPDPGGRRIVRLLAITGGPDVGQLEAAVDREQSGDPVLVLHHGPLGPDLRAQIAERFRSIGRPVAVIDDDLFAHLVASGARRYERTMGLVLPFTTTNPYHLDVSGLVPDTMFFGRRAERDAIMDRHGTSHLYGGRQLGKSALLRHVERAFNATPNQVAIYLDLKGAQVGMPRPPEAVFDVLWPHLESSGIVQGDLPAANVPDIIATAIDRWLGEQPGRRLLVLLDECDNFLKADKDKDLATSARLKDLMERTDRACKFVFAGLHTVQRFASVPNTPMAHLGTPIAIGPLEGAAAAELITKPLHALGYKFEDSELVNRTLAHTSRHPALLVIFCHHLLKKLQARRRLNSEPPFIITEADVDGTWSDPEVAAAIRERVQWTLALDPAYEVITYVIAFLASTNGGSPDHRIPVRDLQAECTYWWPAGFDGYLPEQFRLLADELIGLGVLAREGSRYGLRNPNVARLLGSEDEIETVLEGAHLKKPEETFEPATWRRPVQAADGTTFRSPLSHEQLDQLMAPTIGATVVAGTSANGIDRVGEAVIAAAGGRTKVTVRTWQDPIEPMLRPVGEDRHRIVVMDLRGAPAKNAAATLKTVAEAADPDRPRSGSRGTWSVIVVVDAIRNGSLLRHALTIETLAVMALQRWTAPAVSAFGRDAGFLFAGTEEAEKVVQRTGGWGFLVDRVATEVFGAMRTLAAVLDDAHVDELPARLGIDDDPVVAAAFGVAASLVTGPEMACDLATLAVFLDDSAEVAEAMRVATARDLLPEASGAAIAEQLVLAALLDAGGGNVWVEPVAAEAITGR